MRPCEGLLYAAKAGNQPVDLVAQLRGQVGHHAAGLQSRVALVKEIMDAGVLVLTAGTNAIRLLPPLSISYEEMDEALAVMQKVFCK